MASRASCFDLQNLCRDNHLYYFYNILLWWVFSLLYVFLSRLDQKKVQMEDKRRNTHQRELLLQQQQASAKHISSKSNRLTTAARRRSLEEIFSVLLLSADMAREAENKKKKNIQQEQKRSESGEASLSSSSWCSSCTPFALNCQSLSKARICHVQFIDLYHFGNLFSLQMLRRARTCTDRGASVVERARTPMRSPPPLPLAHLSTRKQMTPGPSASPRPACWSLSPPTHSTSATYWKQWVRRAKRSLRGL